MSKLVLLAPVLAAVWPVIVIYAHNEAELRVSALVAPLLIVLAGSALLTLFLRLVLRSNTKASFVAVVWILVFFSYGHMFDLVQGAELAGLVVGRHRYLFTITLGVLLLPLLVMSRQIISGRVMAVATAVLGGLILFNLGSVRHRLSRGDSEPIAWAGAEVSWVAETLNHAQLPDIYYIVPDRYASQSTFEDRFNYDNSEFIEYLRDSGFYVASESLANYPFTSLSLSSSLNMRHLDFLAEEVGTETGDVTPLVSLLQNHSVGSILKQNGYQFIHFGSMWQPTAKNNNADLNVNLNPMLLGLFEYNEFHLLLINTTMLRLFQEHVVGYPTKAQAILYSFEKLVEIVESEGPKFVFAHLLVPHLPYTLDAECRPVDRLSFNWLNTSLTSEQIELIKARYVDQLICTNKMLRKVIDRVLMNSRRPAIVILQSDEGPYTEQSQPLNPAEWSVETLRIRAGILNAYYVPEGTQLPLYPSISPVNTFRMVFNEYFGVDLPLLEDRTYIYESRDRVYSFIDVTDKIRYGE